MTRRGLVPSGATLFGAIFVGGGFAVGSVRLLDNSFFTHLRTGEWMLDHGIMRADPFSFTAHGRALVSQSWLIELWYGAIDRSPVGALGIRLYHGLVFAALFAGLFALGLAMCRDRVRAAGLTVVAAVGMYPLMSARPQVTAALFFLLIVVAVELPSSWPGRHAAVVFPVTFWFWINVHGTWIVGGGYLVLHLVGRWLEGAPPWQGVQRRVLIGGLWSIPVLFLNPYGYRLVTLPTKLTVGGGVLRYVAEWQSPSFKTVYGAALALWVVLLVMLAARERRASRRDLVIVVPFLLNAFWALRNVGLLYIATLPILARLMRPALIREELARASRAAFATVIALTAVLIVGVRLGQENFNFDRYPVSAMNYLDRHKLLGRRLVTTDADSGYLILRYWPRQLVFIDDRYFYYPDSVLRDAVKLVHPEPGWSKVLAKNRITVVVWPKKSSLSELLTESSAWRRVYRDKKYVVFLRNGVGTS